MSTSTANPSTPAAPGPRQFLATDALGPLMVRLALPAIASQLVNLLYSIVDRMFIGHIPGVGSAALTGVGICLPVIMLVSSFAALAGAGGAPLASMALGQNNQKRANTVLQTSTTLLALFAIMLTIGLIPAAPFLLGLFGASGDTLPYALSYLRIYLLGTVFVMAYLGLTPFLLAQGDSRLSFCAVLTGALLNVILDALFIFGFNMGIEGAAYASIISQGASAVLTVLFVMRPASAFKLKFTFKLSSKELVGRILTLGGAPFFMQATESLILIVLNGQLQHWGGDLYVGALTILTSAMQLITMPASGFTQGTQTIVSYSFGAGLSGRTRKATRAIIGTSFVITLVGAIAIMIFPEVFARIFTPDPVLIDLVHKTAPIYFLGITIFGLQIGIQPIFIGLGQGVCAILVATLRKLVFLIPLAFILPTQMGVWGVYWAEPISDILSVLFCVILYLARVPKLLAK